MKGNHFTLLWDDMSGLIENGYITTDNNGNPESFPDGLLFSFNDIDYNRNELITNADVWYGNLAAYGAKYTLKMEYGRWIVKTVESEWVS